MQRQWQATAVQYRCAAPGTCHGDEGALPHAVQRPGVRPVLGEGAVHEPGAPRQRRKLRCRMLFAERRAQDAYGSRGVICSWQQGQLTAEHSVECVST